MRNIPFIMLLLLSLLACQDVERMEKPDDLIPKEKMTQVLLELALLQGAKTTDRSQFKELGLGPDDYLWDLYDIDSTQFAESNRYYSQNSGEYEEIYLEVQSRLVVLKEQYDSIREEQERVRDSIKAASPADSLERARENYFRDSILTVPTEIDTALPVPVSRERRAEDTIR